MTNPIPQRVPKNILGTEEGGYVQEMINMASQLRDGVPANSLAQINRAAKFREKQFLEDLATVLNQINAGEAANPLNYQIPYTGEAEAFFREMLNAVEQLR